jgi:hypothetical protein
MYFHNALRVGGCLETGTITLCSIAGHAWPMPGCDDLKLLREWLRYRSIDIVDLGATRLVRVRVAL